MVVLLSVVVVSILLLHFFNGERRGQEADDCFERQADEEEPTLEHSRSAAAAFSRSFDSLTIKTEKSKLFKQQSHTRNMSTDISATSVNGILKRSSVTSADADAFRRAPDQESTGSETADEEHARPSGRRVQFRADVSF